MALSPGVHLGAYEIIALVGAGGMGEVYRARDTRLDRTVAIKVLPAPLADRIISTCLAKDPDERYQSARDLLRDLKWVASGSSDGAGARTVTPPARSNRVAWLVAALSTIALIATAVIALRRAGEVTPAAGPVQFTIVPPENSSSGGPPAGSEVEPPRKHENAKKKARSEFRAFVISWLIFRVPSRT